MHSLSQIISKVKEISVPKKNEILEGLREATDTFSSMATLNPKLVTKLEMSGNQCMTVLRQ
jgi:hypothetical protein